MKTESKKIILLFCLFLQSKGEVFCEKGFKGIVSTRPEGEIRYINCTAGSLCGRFEVSNFQSEDGM